jgi:hypothetical protein
MTIARTACIFVSFAAFAGCTLFSDFGGFSEEQGPTDAGPSAEATTTDAPGDSSADSDTGPAVITYRQAVLADQPIAYWPFDEPAGTPITREIIGGKNAEVVGKLAFGVPGADGTGVERTTEGGSLEVGDFFDLAGKQAYAIEFWGLPKGTSEFEDILHKRADNGSGWIVYFRDGNDSVQIEQRYAAGSRTTFVPLPTPKASWHHIVFVYAPNDPTEKRARVYVDGVRTDGFSDDGDADDTAQPLRMHSFIGILDEVAIYHHALSAERISEHYKLGISP